MHEYDPNFYRETVLICNYVWGCGLFLDSLFTRSRVLHVTERLLKSMAVAAMMGFKNPAAAIGMLMML